LREVASDDDRRAAAWVRAAKATRADVRGSDGTSRDFYVRWLWDWKISATAAEGSEAYADQNERDHRALAAAVNARSVVAEQGV
jgi:hypothetical protein